MDQKTATKIIRGEKESEQNEVTLEGANVLGANLKRTNFEGSNLRWVMYLQAKQLCEANTLYNAELYPEFEREVKKERPHLI